MTWLRFKRRSIQFWGWLLFERSDREVNRRYARMYRELKTRRENRMKDQVPFTQSWIQSMNDLLEKCRDRRFKQWQKWGPQDHSLEKWNTILMEEVGELAKACLERNELDIQEEALDVAAVALAIAQSVATKKPV